MTYNLETGTCITNKTGLSWPLANSFCQNLHPGAHLVGIQSETEEKAYGTIFGKVVLKCFIAVIFTKYSISLFYRGEYST